MGGDPNSGKIKKNLFATDSDAAAGSCTSAAGPAALRRAKPGIGSSDKTIIRDHPGITRHEQQTPVCAQYMFIG